VGIYYDLDLMSHMKHIMLYCISDASSKYKSAVYVRDTLAENLVNKNIDTEVVPKEIFKYKDDKELTFYEAGSTGGGVFNDRPYTDLYDFLDEFQRLMGFDLYRIARFEQKENKHTYTKKDIVKKEDPYEKMQHFAKRLMYRINNLNLGESEVLLGKILENLTFRVISDDNIVNEVESEIYSLSPKSGFSQYRANTGPWIVHESSNFDRSKEELFYDARYCFDCTNSYPKPNPLEELESTDNKYIVEAKTRY
jgi:hypothetical protein